MSLMSSSEEDFSDATNENSEIRMERPGLTFDLTVKEHVHLRRFFSPPERINMSLQPTEEETAAKIGHIKKIGSLYSNGTGRSKVFCSWHLSFLSHLVVEDLEILADDTTTAEAYVYECVPFIEQCKYTKLKHTMNVGDKSD